METNNLLPTCSMYKKYLDTICQLTDLTIDEARSCCGKLTINELDNLIQQIKIK